MNNINERSGIKEIINQFDKLGVLFQPKGNDSPGKARVDLIANKIFQKEITDYNKKTTDPLPTEPTKPFVYEPDASKKSKINTILDILRTKVNPLPSIKTQEKINACLEKIKEVFQNVNNTGSECLGNIKKLLEKEYKSPFVKKATPSSDSGSVVNDDSDSLGIDGSDDSLGDDFFNSLKLQLLVGEDGKKTKDGDYLDYSFDFLKSSLGGEDSKEMQGLGVRPCSNENDIGSAETTQKKIKRKIKDYMKQISELCKDVKHEGSKGLDRIRALLLTRRQQKLLKEINKIVKNTEIQRKNGLASNNLHKIFSNCSITPKILEEQRKEDQEKLTKVLELLGEGLEEETVN